MSAPGKISKAMSAYLRVCSSGGMPKELREQVQRSVDEAERLGYFEAEEQTACVMLISKRAKAEAGAAEAEAKGYPDVAKSLRMQAQAASEVEQALRRRAPAEMGGGATTDELRAAFDGDSVARKNLALRKASDEITRLRCVLADVEALAGTLAEAQRMAGDALAAKPGLPSINA